VGVSYDTPPTNHNNHQIPHGSVAIPYVLMAIPHGYMAYSLYY